MHAPLFPQCLHVRHHTTIVCMLCCTGARCAVNASEFACMHRCFIVCMCAITRPLCACSAVPVPGVQSTPQSLPACTVVSLFACAPSHDPCVHALLYRCQVCSQRLRVCLHAPLFHCLHVRHHTTTVCIPCCIGARSVAVIAWLECMGHGR